MLLSHCALARMECGKSLILLAIIMAVVIGRLIGTSISIIALKNDVGKNLTIKRSPASDRRAVVSLRGMLEKGELSVKIGFFADKANTRAERRKENDIYKTYVRVLCCL